MSEGPLLALLKSRLDMVAHPFVFYFSRLGMRFIKLHTHILKSFSDEGLQFAVFRFFAHLYIK